MKSRTERLCGFTLISLLVLFGFAQAGAQDTLFNRLSHPVQLHSKTGKARKAEIADVSTSYTYGVLYSFCSAANCSDGSDPQFGNLIQDVAGNLYGTTFEGGANGTGTMCGVSGCGSVFKLDSTGHETVLYSFCSASNCTDGAYPYAGVIEDAAGNLYGTTFAGGANKGGTVFKVDTTGQETVLYSFCSAANCTDGQYPYASLIRDAAGNLYGTTVGGGNSSAECLAYAGSYSCGTVFKVDSTGQETVLYKFCSESKCTDGDVPFAGLIQDSAGNLYGTTDLGGANNGGTVFKVNSMGQETVLYSFCSDLINNVVCADGAQPYASLIQDAAGNLYGTTLNGGIGNGGTVFRLDNTGQETVLYDFLGLGGASPYASLIQDSASNLYGTTAEGGASNADSSGTVFKLAPPVQAGGAWTETVLYSFCSLADCTDGATPYAGLFQDAGGNLYGTTTSGGANGPGTVFKLAAVSSLPTPTVTVTPSASSITTAQALTVTLTVIGTSGEPTPTGAVTLSSGSYSSAATTLSSGGATIVVPAGSLAVGTDTLTVTYSGDSNYTAATGTNSVTVTAPVLPTPTVTLTPSSSSITTAQALMVTIGVNGGTGNPTPTGTVTLTSGGYASAATTLSNGSATITIPAGSLAVGTDTLTASYSGDTNYSSATGTNSITVVPFSVGGTAVSVSPGATTGNTSTITVTPIGGFTGSVALTATVTSSPSGAQDPPTLSFGSTSPVIINSAAAGTATLTITTTAASSTALAYPSGPGAGWSNAGGVGSTFILGIFFLFLGIATQGRNWRTRLGLLLLPVILTAAFLACGGGSSGGGGGGGTGNPGTTPGTYTVTVSATSGIATATSTITLTVQ